MTKDELTSVLVRKGDPDFGVEWSLSGAVATPARVGSNKPQCEEFTRTQYDPKGASLVVGQEWLGASGEQTKNLQEVVTSWPTDRAAEDFLAGYRGFVRSCSRYVSGGVDGDSFAMTSKRFKVGLPSSRYVAWTTGTKLTDVDDLPATYGSAVVVRRGIFVVLAEYNTSDGQQPAGVGRKWAASYAKTMDGRLADLIG